jgi:hypothetical protein
LTEGKKQGIKSYVTCKKRSWGRSGGGKNKVGTEFDEDCIRKLALQDLVRRGNSGRYITQDEWQWNVEHEMGYRLLLSG